jgi:hypothetical protein
MHYVNSVVVHFCKICEFFYYPLQSFVCHHRIVIKDLKNLNIKILEIQKMVIVVFVRFGALEEVFMSYKPHGAWRTTEVLKELA